VLVVEDDRSISEFVEMELAHQGMDVRCAHDGPSGLAGARGFSPEVVILDVMLPGMSGVGVLRALRREGSRVPVLMLTARGRREDKLHGLDSGADDYLTKPFDVEELLARLRALLRRAQGEEVLRLADLEVNVSTREVRRGGRCIELTPREFEFLEFMARNPRRVLDRDLLLERVWGGEPLERKVVDVYVGYLRKKVDGPGEAPLIRTVRGLGYALRDR
jgi:DNA-binding response OmpR family regulator